MKTNEQLLAAASHFLMVHTARAVIDGTTIEEMSQMDNEQIRMQAVAHLNVADEHEKAIDGLRAAVRACVKKRDKATRKRKAKNG